MRGRHAALTLRSVIGAGGGHSASVPAPGREASYPTHTASQTPLCHGCWCEGCPPSPPSRGGTTPPPSSGSRRTPRTRPVQNPPESSRAPSSPASPSELYLCTCVRYGLPHLGQLCLWVVGVLVLALATAWQLLCWGAASHSSTLPTTSSGPNPAPGTGARCPLVSTGHKQHQGPGFPEGRRRPWQRPHQLQLRGEPNLWARRRSSCITPG